MKQATSGSIRLLIAVLAWGIAAASAHADDSAARARADSLFSSGKERMAQGQYAQACAMFAESYKLDPATGSLLALALCYERDNKLASAQENYVAAATRAHAENQPAREEAATARAKALDAEVSHLVIEAKDVDLAHGTVFLNGRPMRPEQLDVPIALDGGTAYVDLRVDGTKVWSTQAQIASKQGRAFVHVPSLRVPADRAASAPPVAAAPVETKPTPAPAREPRPNQRLKWLSVGLMSAGGAGLALGLGFSLRAILKNNDSDAGCSGDVCHGEARESRLEARRAGNAATVSLTLGTALAASGVVTYFLGWKRQGAKLDARRLPTPWVMHQGGGASIQGAF
ncbi:MAG: hypothetical protein QM778_10615 [Myxococcales bacterium]